VHKCGVLNTSIRHGGVVSVNTDIAEICALKKEGGSPLQNGSQASDRAVHTHTHTHKGGTKAT
jgi:hypothetical protein